MVLRAHFFSLAIVLLIYKVIANVEEELKSNQTWVCYFLKLNIKLSEDWNNKNII